jgi:hypothetical protein
VFVEIIMYVSAAKVTLLTLILGFCLMQTPIILRLVSPGVLERVDYGSMCFEPDAHVLLKREPTDGHGCQFSSPNLPDGWSINPSTGDIEGIAEAGDMRSIQVYATTEAGVLNTTVAFEVATLFAQPKPIVSKTVQDATGIAVTSAILFYLSQPWSR